MRKQDIDECLDIFKEHGFTPSVGSLFTYQAIDPEGCFVLTSRNDEGNDVVIAFCSSSKYDPRIAVVSFYGTRKGYQGLGLGVNVWKEMMASFLSSSPIIGLCSSRGAAQMYREKAGFAVTDPRGMLVFKSEDRLDVSSIKTDTIKSYKTLTMCEVPWNDLVSFDESIAGLNRDKFLSLSLSEKGTYCLVAVDCSSNKIIGYAAVKPTTGDKINIGPVYATDYSTAEGLLCNLLASYKVPTTHENGFFYFCLDDHKDSVRLANSIGLKSDMIPSPRLLTAGRLDGIKYDNVFALLSSSAFL